MKEPYRKGEQRIHPGLESCRGHREVLLKRRQGYRWAGLLSFEKPMEQDADSVPVGRKAKQHAREPGDLLHVLVKRSRPVREGHKPNGGRERTGEVGLCRSTHEPVEQRRATFCGGWGGKGTDSGEHRSISHAPDTEWETHVPGTARCATGSKR